MCFSIWKVYGILCDYNEAKDEYEDLEGEVTVLDVESDEGGEEGEMESFYVDFDALQSMNPDCVAWIRFENLDISYPVMQGTDNEYYLTHTFSGEKLTSASIFMDYRNASDFSDMVTIIYGHNMKNDTMFGLLHEYEDEANYADNSYFWIYTPEATYRYDIFSCYTTEDLDYVIYYNECDEYTEYVQKLKANSSYDTGVEVSGSDHVVMLSTCTGIGHDYRYVVCGVMAEKRVNN